MTSVHHHGSPAAALRERLLATHTEAELAAGFAAPLPCSHEDALPIHVWTGSLPRPAAALRTCSRGCHSLPASAKFDPHTGKSLDDGARPARRAGKLVLRTV